MIYRLKCLHLFTSRYQAKSDLVIKHLTEHEEVFTSLRVIEEASYIVIRVKASKLHGARGIYDVRRIVNKHGPDF